MFSRVIFRNSFKIFRPPYSKVFIPTKYQKAGIVYCKTLDQATNLNTSFTICKYSTKEAAIEENHIVDFDYVKKVIVDKNAVIIDVREQDELKEHGHIPSSINIPLGNIPEALNLPENEFKDRFKRPKPTKDSEIIFYCMIGKRSGKAQQEASNLGYKKAKNYLGSWMEWASKYH